MLPLDHSDLPARPAAPPTARHARLDALRGLAMVWMTAFHFSFDLNHFGWIRQDFYRDPFWTWQRTCIVSLFLLCAGMGQAVAVQQGQPWPRFWRRWGQVVLGALLVSLGSWLMFPRSFITFGVLHGMAVMLLLLRWAGPRLPGAALLALAALALAAPSLWQHPWFDTRWTNWLGLITHKPVTEDYVPVLPWLGVMLLGFALGRALAARRGWLDAGLPRLLRPLAWLGQWSLSYYLLHQPVLIGALMMLGGMGLAR